MDPVDPLTVEGLDAWRALEAEQQPQWPDQSALAAAVAELSVLPPLVFAGECDNLRERLSAAARGEAFVLQGGDCAETFVDATADKIRNRIKTVLQMAAVLTYGASVPVIKLGRMAGQFAKPRSSDDEVRDGVTLPAYRGDAVNDFAFTPESRVPDPSRLVRAYHTSASTLNLIRAFTQGGFADLRHVHEWNRGFVSNAANAQYEALAGQIDRAMRFMAACGADFDALQGRRLLLLARGPAARLRARADPDRLAHRAALRRVGALRLGRGADPQDRRRAHRLRLAGAQPDRREAQREDQPGRRARPDRQARPGPHARVG